MFQPPCRSMEFNRNRDAGGQPRRQPKPKPQSQPKSNSKHNRVSNRPRKQPQRPMLPAQQIVSQVKTPNHIEECPRNADRRHSVMVHAKGFYDQQAGLFSREITSGVPHFSRFLREVGISAAPIRIM